MTRFCFLIRINSSQTCCLRVVFGVSGKQGLLARLTTKARKCIRANQKPRTAIAPTPLTNVSRKSLSKNSVLAKMKMNTNNGRAGGGGGGGGGGERGVRRVRTHLPLPKPNINTYFSLWAKR